MGKLLTMFLAIILMISTIFIPVTAAAEPDYVVCLNGWLDTNNTYVVEFQVKTANGATLAKLQSIKLSVDYEVLKHVRWDSSPADNINNALTPSLVDLPQYMFSCLEGWATGSSFRGAKSANGERLLMKLEPSKSEDVFDSPDGYAFETLTTLEAIRFVFQPGYSFENLTADTIRLMNAEELQATNQSEQVALNNPSDPVYKYGTQANGEFTPENDTAGPNALPPIISIVRPNLITVAPIENGTVTADKTVAYAGEAITLTVIGNPGYELEEGSLMYNGRPVVGYSFIMPAEDVTITAEFKPESGGDDGKLVISAPSVISYPGQMVTVDISIGNNPSVNGFTVNLPFDSKKLEFVSIGTEALEALGYVYLNDDKTSGVSLTWLAYGGDLLTIEGKLFTVTFKIRYDAPGGEIPLLLSGVIGDQMGYELSADFEPGAIKVIPYMLGDINGDGRVDILDAILLQRIWLGDLIPDARQQLAANVNRDERIDGNDLVLLLMHIANPDDVPLG